MHGCNHEDSYDLFVSVDNTFLVQFYACPSYIMSSTCCCASFLVFLSAVRSLVSRSCKALCWSGEVIVVAQVRPPLDLWRRGRGRGSGGPPKVQNVCGLDSYFLTKGSIMRDLVELPY